MAETLAQAAETSIERVMVCSLHQRCTGSHGCSSLFGFAGVAKRALRSRLSQKLLGRAVQAMKRSLKDERPLTHIGYADALVKVHPIGFSIPMDE